MRQLNCDCTNIGGIVLSYNGLLWISSVAMSSSARKCMNESLKCHRGAQQDIKKGVRVVFNLRKINLCADLVRSSFKYKGRALVKEFRSGQGAQGSS